MLKKFDYLHGGETCVILGNGRKLGQADRQLLEQHITIATNKIFLCQTAPEGLHDDCKVLAGFVPNYWVCVDRYMIHDCTPALYNGWWPKREDGAFVPRADNQGYSPGYPVKNSNQIMIEISAGFARSFTEAFVIGGTVTFVALQMAYAMGFKNTLLVGIDHHYGKYQHKKPHSVMIAEGEDDAHFHKDYFSHGHIYAAAALEDTPRSYALARRVFEGDNRLLLNLTPDTMLKEIEIGDVKDWI